MREHNNVDQEIIAKGNENNRERERQRWSWETMDLGGLLRELDKLYPGQKLVGMKQVWSYGQSSLIPQSGLISKEWCDVSVFNGRTLCIEHKQSTWFVKLEEE